MVYENEHYTVEVVDSTISEPLGIPVYGLVNKATSVREGEFPYFPQAVQYADQLSESINEWENSATDDADTEPADVVQFPH